MKKVQLMKKLKVFDVMEVKELHTMYTERYVQGMLRSFVDRRMTHILANPKDFQAFNSFTQDFIQLKKKLWDNKKSYVFSATTFEKSGRANGGYCLSSYKIEYGDPKSIVIGSTKTSPKTVEAQLGLFA